MSLPLVSCLMPTCGRYPHHGHLLDESVLSFLRQDYAGPKELIIVNDCPGQSVLMETPVPYIAVFNFNGRFRSLGLKYNVAAKYARGSILLPWEDDDISLPHRISQAVERLSNHDYFNPQQSWFYDGEKLYKDHSHGVCHNASAFTRETFDWVGGYPDASIHQDYLMDARLKERSRVSPLLDDPADWSYIYCWGRGYHLSGDPDKDRAYDKYGEQTFTPGVYYIRPRYLRDYEGMVAQVLSILTTGSVQ